MSTISFFNRATWSKSAHPAFLKAIREENLEELKTATADLLSQAKGFLVEIAVFQIPIIDKQEFIMRVADFVNEVYLIQEIMTCDEMEDLTTYHEMTIGNFVNKMIRFVVHCKSTTVEDVMVTIRRLLYAEMVIMDSSSNTDLRWMFDDTLKISH